MRPRRVPPEARRLAAAGLAFVPSGPTRSNLTTGAGTPRAFCAPATRRSRALGANTYRVSDAAEIDLGFASVHWTHSAMFGQEFSAAEMQHKLGQIAVGDLLEAVGRLSCMVEGAEATTEGRQLQILRRLGLFDEASITRLEGLFAPREGGRPRSLFFPQQIIELSRQAIRYGDRRERDGFAEGKLAGDFLRCIFGVTDLLGTELDDMTETSVRRFILLQMGLGSRQETMYLFTRYYDLLVRLWPEVHGTAGRFAPADAFREYTGLTLDEFFILGFAVFTRFLNHVDHVHEPSDFALYPTKYFASTRLDPRSWRRFLDLLSKTPNQLRHALAVETEDYGPGLHRCHTFDRTPLVRLDEVYVPTSFASLERAVTEGAFWLLADAAEAKGLPREEFTAPFGKVFERFAQESLERIASKEATPPKTKRDFYYGPKRARTLSSDMIFLYDREGVFFEVATGRPSVATTTRGDERAFQHDLRKLIVKKADQLRRCWRDFMVLGRFEGRRGGSQHDPHSLAGAHPHRGVSADATGIWSGDRAPQARRLAKALAAAYTHRCRRARRG